MKKSSAHEMRENLDVKKIEKAVNDIKKHQPKKHKAKKRK